MTTMIPACRHASAFLAMLLFLLGAALQADETGGGKAPAGLVLFDGKSIDDWEHIGPGRFVLEDGLLKTEG